MKKINILFVCTGNTCRSPMAEYIAKKQISEIGVEITAESAGISASDGELPTASAVEVMKEYGIDISSHSATRFSSEIAENADYIFVMTLRHLNFINMMYPALAKKTFLLGRTDISDPFGCGTDIYRKARDELDIAIKNRLSEICGESVL